MPAIKDPPRHEEASENAPPLSGGASQLIAYLQAADRDKNASATRERKAASAKSRQ